MEKEKKISFIGLVKSHFLLWIIINIVLCIGINDVLASRTLYHFVDNIKMEIRTNDTIKSLNLSEEEKNEMNYDALCEDIRYKYTGKGKFNAELKMQFRGRISADNFYLNKSIDEINLNKLIVGGEEPIKFYKVSGPDWINVSEDGMLSGTPTELADKDKLIVKAIDSEGTTAEGTFGIPSIKEELESKEDKSIRTNSDFGFTEPIDVDGSEPYIYYGEGYFIEDDAAMDAITYGIYKSNGDRIGEIWLDGGEFRSITPYIIKKDIEILIIDIVLNYLLYRIIRKVKMKKEREV